MTLEKDQKHFFDSVLITEIKEYGIIFRLYKNRIFHVIIPPNRKVGIENIETGYRILDENGGGKYYNIYQFNYLSDVEPEVREWAASQIGNHYTFCDAIVIKNWGQKIMTDFYLKFNKPKMPTKIFYSVEKAYDWIKEFRKVNTK